MKAAFTIAVKAVFKPASYCRSAFKTGAVGPEGLL